MKLFEISGQTAWKQPGKCFIKMIKLTLQYFEIRYGGYGVRNTPE